MRRRRTTKGKPHRKTNAKSAATKPRKTAARMNTRRPDGPEEAIQRLVETGLLRPATKPWRMPPFTPRPIRGPSIVQTIREERDDS